MLNLLSKVLKNKTLTYGIVAALIILAAGYAISEARYGQNDLPLLLNRQIDFQKKLIDVEKQKVNADDDFSPEEKKSLEKKLDEIQSNLKPSVIAKAVNEMRIKRTGEYPEIYLVFLYKNDIHVLELKHNAFIDTGEE